MRQTRPDIGYDIARLAAESALAFAGPFLARQCVDISLYSKTVRSTHAYNRDIVYNAPPHQSGSTRSRLREIAQRRMIASADAGFGAWRSGQESFGRRI